MFGEIEGMVQRFASGEIDQQSVAQAAQSNVSSMDHEELTEHLQTAADNAQQNGQSGIAQQIMGLISQHGSDPAALKQEAISLISNNPQILTHFAPDFAKGILGSL
ncbi:MAG: hypothetical protein JO351_11375 [Candidatus Eremiobacteraeota bacterium]|nr:hypothetical protein [Candidatus Eremiobacteraeota bacterium]MBV9057221.1 hypothetical protein [Candidatus Eremiobacteraeota bacterium]